MEKKTENPPPSNDPQPGEPQAKPEASPWKGRAHRFEDRHWVNEACGDDLWDQ